MRSTERTIKSMSLESVFSAVSQKCTLFLVCSVERIFLRFALRRHYISSDELYCIVKA